MKPATAYAKHKANRKIALAKLAKMGVVIPAVAVDRTLCNAIVDVMYWTPPSAENFRDFIERFAEHKPGEKAKPRTMFKRGVLNQSADLAMQEAIRRSERQPRLFSMNSKPQEANH